MDSKQNSGKPRISERKPERNTRTCKETQKTRQTAANRNFKNDQTYIQKSMDSRGDWGNVFYFLFLSIPKKSNIHVENNIKRFFDKAPWLKEKHVKSMDPRGDKQTHEIHNFSFG